MSDTKLFYVSLLALFVASYTCKIHYTHMYKNMARREGMATFYFKKEWSQKMKIILETIKDKF